MSNFNVGIIRVSMRDQYRRKALECLLAADGLAEPDSRAAMLEMARSWMRLAEHTEPIGSLDAAVEPPDQSPDPHTP